MDVEQLRQHGFPFWVAPELLQGGSPSTASDVYAVGMLLYEMLYRTEPFSGEDPEVLPSPLCESVNQFAIQPGKHSSSSFSVRFLEPNRWPT